MGFTGQLLELSIFLIQKGGYLGVFIGLVLDSAGIPIPSELILGLAGSLAKTGVFNLWLLIIVGTIAQVLGAYLSYLVGRYGGEPLIRKYGKYLLISSHDLNRAIRWFEKRGDRAVFISRLVPVIRTYIGFSAGIFKMKLSKFIKYTLFGSLIWSTVFVIGGYLLNDSLRKLYKYLHYVDYVIIIVVIFYTVRFFYRKLKKK